MFLFYDDSTRKAQSLIPRTDARDNAGFTGAVATIASAFHFLSGVELNPQRGELFQRPDRIEHKVNTWPTPDAN